MAPLLLFVVFVIFTIVLIESIVKAPDIRKPAPDPINKNLSKEIPEDRWEFKNVYSKKDFLFDHSTEFHFFKILEELFADQYYIFPQMNINHLARVRGGNNYYGKKFLTRIDKKSVDFILCDKVRVVPKIAIELDGSSHFAPHRVQRDHFVDNLMDDIGLPIVHIQAGTTDRITIKNAVLNKLSNSQ